MDGVFLLKLMESYSALLPYGVVVLKFFLVDFYYLFVELIVFYVLNFILGLVLLSEFNKELVYCRL